MSYNFIFTPQDNNQVFKPYLLTFLIHLFPTILKNYPYYPLTSFVT